MTEAVPVGRGTSRLVSEFLDRTRLFMGTIHHVCRRGCAALICLWLLVLPVSLWAGTPGQLDMSFLSPVPNGPVYALNLQTNGTIFIGGTFSGFLGLLNRAGVARLNADGSVAS